AGLFLGQAINEIIHDDVSHLDVLASGVVEMVASNGEGVAIAAKNKNMQVGTADGNARGKGQSAAMKVMHAMGLDEIRKPARTANAGNGGNLFMPKLALFDQLEIEGENRKVAAARAPGGVVGGNFLFC